MAVLDIVKSLQRQGVPEEKIIESLQDKGVPYKDISEALAQSKIKAAVEAADEYQQDLDIPSPDSQENMQPSLMPPQYQPQSPSPEEYTSPDSQEQPYDSSFDYSPQQGSLSSDTISEIAEQVVTEKIMEMRKHLERVTDFKTTIEAKTESIEERLKRIEKIIDTLQSSVLRKVGDYVTNVDDIKRELIETQKTFASIVKGKHKLSHEKSHEHRQDQVAEELTAPPPEHHVTHPTHHAHHAHHNLEHHLRGHEGHHKKSKHKK